MFRYHNKLFFYRKDNEASQDADQISKVYGYYTVTRKTAAKRFTRFQSDRFAIKNAFGSGRLIPKQRRKEIYKHQLFEESCTYELIYYAKKIMVDGN